MVLEEEVELVVVELVVVALWNCIITEFEITFEKLTTIFTGTVPPWGLFALNANVAFPLLSVSIMLPNGNFMYIEFVTGVKLVVAPGTA